MTRSPWLIHTVSRSPFFHTPANNAVLAVTSNIGAAEFAVVTDPQRLPPSCATMICSP